MEDIHARWSHRWLTPKAESRNSDIHGLGVFAIQKIQAKEEVAVLGGVTIHTSEIKDYWNEMGHVGIQIDHNFFIVPTNRKELEEKGVFNHSCEPNIGFSNSITFVAIRDISPEEELVFDYAFNETFHDSMECHCGTETCRKIIKPDDWKDLKLKEQYGHFYSPYLRDAK